MHTLIGQCFCEKPESDTLQEDDVLYHLWEFLRRSPENCIPSALDATLRARINSSTTGDSTLLHNIAMCSHPEPKSGEVDIVKRIGEILISRDCSVNAVAHDISTPLSLAVNTRQFGLIELLLESGGQLKNPMATLETIVDRHDYQMLDKIQSIWLSPTLNGDENVGKRCHLLALGAVCVPLAERRLRHGQYFRTRGEQTLKYLLRHAYGRSPIPQERIMELLSEALIYGNADLLSILLEYSPDLNKTLSNPTPKNSPLLHQSIIHLNQEIFDILLTRGADINAPLTFEGSLKADINRFLEQDLPEKLRSLRIAKPTMRPVQLAAMALDSNQYFLEVLIKHGAKLDFVDDNGNTLLDQLILAERAAPFIRSVLIKAPNLVNSKRDQPILHKCVLGGFPSGIIALLENGVDIGQTAGEGGDTALMAGLASSREMCVNNLKTLLTYAKSSLKQMRPQLGQALLAACMFGNVLAIQVLLEFGADPNFVTLRPGLNFPISPLFSALHRRMMFQNNLDMNIKIQAQEEEKKFNKSKRLLLQYGAREDLQYGRSLSTAQEFCNRIFDK